VCGDIGSYLPSFCNCKNVDDGAHVLCATTVLDQDLKFSLLVAPCESPATIKFEISVDGEPWDYSVTAGDTGSVDIPGLSFGIGCVTRTSKCAHRSSLTRRFLKNLHLPLLHVLMRRSHPTRTHARGRAKWHWWRCALRDGILLDAC